MVVAVRVAGLDVYYLQTTNSRYRLELRRSVPTATETSVVR